MGRARGIDGLDDLDIILNIEERIDLALEEEFNDDFFDEDEIDFDWGEE